MRISLAALAVGAVLVAASLGRAADAPKFDQTGTVSTGTMAIGGETTGTILKTEAGSFELTPTNAAVGKQIAALKDKKAHVTGTLTVKEGIEVGQRKIVTVESIEAVKE